MAEPQQLVWGQGRDWTTNSSSTPHN